MGTKVVDQEKSDGKQVVEKRSFFDKVFGRRKEVRIEEKAALGVAVGVNADGRATPSGSVSLSRRKTEIEYDDTNGTAQVKDKRLTLTSPGMRSNFGATVLNRDDKVVARAEGMFDLKEQKSGRTKMNVGDNGK